MVPQVDPVQPLPFSVQVTLVSAMPVTVAVNCCAFPITTCAETGDTVTPIGGRTVRVADADFDESATDVALIVTCAGFGRVEGAV